jgi:phosphoadenosine phosphosulfate reductase
LRGKRAWITGLRRDQAPTRKELAVSEFDAGNGLQKISPLLDWSLSDVWAYIKQFNVPYSALHDRGYTSIGCAPCTRAITPGEDVRAGRWWWEDPEIRECGLHPDKRRKEKGSKGVEEEEHGALAGAARETIRIDQ